MTTPQRKARTFRLTGITITHLEWLSQRLDTNKTAVLEMAIAQLVNHYPPMPLTGATAA